jgi:ubiquinone/menaquinone biosynthesis C-methylase UbiE
VVGIDPDPKALALAKTPSCEGDGFYPLRPGFGDDLPYTTATFDRVFSSFMFHHLPPNEKGEDAEYSPARLQAWGEFHIINFEGP